MLLYTLFTHTANLLLLTKGARFRRAPQKSLSAAPPARYL